MPTVVNFGYMVLVMEAQMWMDWSDRAVPNVYHLPEYTKVCMGQPSFSLGSASQMINFVIIYSILNIKITSNT